MVQIGITIATPLSIEPRRVSTSACFVSYWNIVIDEVREQAGSFTPDALEEMLAPVMILPLQPLPQPHS